MCAGVKGPDARAHAQGSRAPEVEKQEALEYAVTLGEGGGVIGIETPHLNRRKKCGRLKSSHGHYLLRFTLKRSALGIEAKGLGRELNPGPPPVELRRVEFPP